MCFLLPYHRISFLFGWLNAFADHAHFYRIRSTQKITHIFTDVLMSCAPNHVVLLLQFKRKPFGPTSLLVMGNKHRRDEEMTMNKNIHTKYCIYTSIDTFAAHSPVFCIPSLSLSIYIRWNGGRLASAVLYTLSLCSVDSKCQDCTIWHLRALFISERKKKKKYFF